MEYNVQFSSQNDKVSTDVNVQGGKTFALHLFKNGQTLEAAMQSNEQALDASFSSVQVIGGGGSDGFSPIVDVEPIEGGHRLTITDAQGTETADIMDGQDGISPVVSVEDIDGGHRVTITDKDGEKVFDVMDGKDGDGGSGGAAVQSDWAVNDESDPAFVKNRTHWADEWPEIVIRSDYTSMDSFDASALGMGRFDKISNDAWPKEKCLHITAQITLHDTGHLIESFEQPVELLSMDGVIAFSLKVGWGYTFYFVSAEKVIDLSAVYGFVIPSPGMYIMQTDWQVICELKISCPKTYHKIDSGFMPDVVVQKDYVNHVEDIYMGGEVDLVIDGDQFINVGYGDDLMESGVETERLHSGLARMAFTFGGKSIYEITFTLTREPTQYSGAALVEYGSELVVVTIAFQPQHGGYFKAQAKSLQGLLSR